MQPIEELGNAVARAWLDCDNRDDAFPSIASRALQQSRLLQRVSQDQLAEWFLTESRLPDQQFRDFGQPALTLYRGHKFYIELLYWLDSTTAIHQHSFAGAFGVFAGASLHTRYDFRCDEIVSSELVFGDLTFRSAELLRQGDVREIVPGDGLIHSLFHLDRPSITLVVRTNSLARSYPQYSYRKPGIAYDPFYTPEPFATRLRLLEALRDTGHERYWDLACEVLRQSDPWMTYALLSALYGHANDTAEWNVLVDLARRRYGSRVDMFLQSFEERTREQNITNRRREIRDPDHRFFLALLLNVPHRRAISQLIAEKCPGMDPEALILQWVGELSAAHKIGLEFDPLSLKMLQHALRDLTLDDMMRGLAEVFGEAHVAEESGNLNRLWREIHDSTLLRPLLRPGMPDCVINPVAHIDAQSRDGRLAFSIEAPVRGESLRCTTVSAESHPDVFPLLTRAMEQGQDLTLTLAGQEADALRSVGLLVPADRISRPVELDVTVSTDEFKADMLSRDPMSDVVFNPGPDRLPVVPLRTLPGGAIVLARDAARQTWFPYSLSGQQLEALRTARRNDAASGTAADAERVQWCGMLDHARRKLHSHRFAFVSSVLPQPLISAVAQYYRQRVEEGYFSLKNGHSNQYATHREPLAEWIHATVADMLRPAFPVDVKPSYSYVCVYKTGATLDRHTDRPQCEFTVSLCVDAGAGGNGWPLYIESPADNAVIEARVRVGSAVIFKGRELPHFRRTLSRGGHVTSLLLHFVETGYQGELD
jgi:hypothetical protein